MMNMHKISLKLCRLCGKEKAKGTNVFKDKIKGAVLISIINKYFPKEVITMSISDSFSKYVCNDCEHKICTFDEFCLMVANVQKELTAPSLEIDFAEDMLCHLKENELSAQKKSPNGKPVPQKKYTCEQCAKSFRCQAYLTRHKRIHNGQRPFICNICSLSFNQQEILNRHLKCHQEEKEFKCENCLQSFRFKVSLKSHMLNFHSDMNNSTTDLQFNKSLSCPECGKTFATKYKFQRHIRCHTGEKPFSCNYCNRRFSQTGNFKLHLARCSCNAENQILPIIQVPSKVLEVTEGNSLGSNVQIDNATRHSIELGPESSHDINNKNDCESLEHFSASSTAAAVYITETEIQNTINQTFNSTAVVDPCISSFLNKDDTNPIYIDADEIETILERDLQHLVTATSNPAATLAKYPSNLQEQIPLCIKPPETPELFHSLLYDV